MTYGILEARDHDKIRGLILNSKETTFVHKSIEKTQKYLNFWVFFRGFLCFRVEAPWNDCEPLRPRPKHALAA
jgi:hypothetical protein